MSLLKKIRRAMLASKRTGKTVLVFHGASAYRVNQFGCVRV